MVGVATTFFWSTRALGWFNKTLQQKKYYLVSPTLHKPEQVREIAFFLFRFLYTKITTAAMLLCWGGIIFRLADILDGVGMPLEEPKYFWKCSIFPEISEITKTPKVENAKSGKCQMRCSARIELVVGNDGLRSERKMTCMAASNCGFEVEFFVIFQLLTIKCNVGTF